MYCSVQYRIMLCVNFDPFNYCTENLDFKQTGAMYIWGSEAYLLCRCLFPFVQHKFLI